MIEDILGAAEPAADKIREFEGKIRLVGQYDADGICATAIAHEMLDRLGKEFDYEILKQLYEEDVERLAEEDEGMIIFVDIGSGQSEAVHDEIMEKTDKQVVISDHHSPQAEEEESESYDDLVHLNPHFYGHDGGEAISAAGMTYLLAETIDEDNRDLIDFALIGATGDVQKQDGEFLGLNQKLEEKALQEDLVEKRQGLALYGRTTKPVHKSLMYTSDPYLEGITNSESGAIQFLKSAGVDIRDNGDFKTLEDLTEEEEKKLIQALIKQGYEVEPLLQNVYKLENGMEIDEFSTIINACGRLNQPEKGVEILLEGDMDLAEKMSNRYGRRISDALGYVEENRDNPEVVSDDGIGIIDAGDSIDENFIGTVTTIAMSNGFFDSNVVMGLAAAEKEKLKISSRARKDVVEDGLNLGEIVEECAKEVEGEGGGHNVAAGAKIPREEKEEFLEIFRDKVN